MAGKAAVYRACNHLYLWDARLAYASHGYVSREHAHFAATLIIALRGRFRLTAGRRVHRRCAAALIRPNRRFAIEAPDTDVLILNQDPDADGYAALASCLGGRGHRLLSPTLFRPLREEFEALMRGDPDCAEAGAVFESVLALLDPRVRIQSAPAPQLDPRVRAVAHTLRRQRPGSICVAELADGVDTSADRLMRLFGRQLGLPIRRYLLWLKLRSAISLLQRGRNLTHIAQDAGFYDSAHMVRTATGMYGVRLGGFNDTRFVQVHHCDPCHLGASISRTHKP